MCVLGGSSLSSFRRKRSAQYSRFSREAVGQRGYQTVIMAVVNETLGVRQLVKKPATSRHAWMAASAAWTALIFFSSTSIASEYCERAFAWIYGSMIGKQFPSDKAFDWMHFLAEKSVHLTLFFVLGILLWQVFTATQWRRVCEVVLLGLIVGTASELVQSFFPDRDPALRDVVINVTGTFLGAAVCARKNRR